MTWIDYALARQVIAEEFFGSKVREVGRSEQAEARATIAAIKGRKP